MTELDNIFSKLLRNTIGFDHLPDFTYKHTGFPAYNIIRDGDNEYTLELALAGYGPDDVEVVKDNGKLSISSTKKVEENDNAEANYLYRGLAKRSFSVSLHLEQHIEVKGAEFDNGLLKIKLEREIPESLKPTQIPITSTNALEHKT